MTASGATVCMVLASLLGTSDPKEILDRIDDLYRSKSSIARMEIVVTSPRTTRSLRLRAWSRGKEEALVIIEAPPREGCDGVTQCYAVHAFRKLAMLFRAAGDTAKEVTWSGHADKHELRRYVEAMTGDMKKISVIHGEESQALAFAETLRGMKPRAEVIVPEYRQVVTI